MEKPVKRRYELTAEYSGSPADDAEGLAERLFDIYEKMVRAVKVGGVYLDVRTIILKELLSKDENK